ncbi:MAG: type II secretion system protein [bacterium]
MFSKHTKKRGFTLIELVVSIFIFVTLAGLVIANFNRGAKSDDLRRAASEAASVLRKAQNLALIGSQQNLPAGAIATTGKFGVHFDKTAGTYQLFLDYQDGGDGGYDIGEEMSGAFYHLPEKVIINSLTPAGDFLDVTFWPPQPTIYFNNVTEPEDEAIIELKHTKTDSLKYLKINRVSGRVSIEDQL